MLRYLALIVGAVFAIAGVNSQASTAGVAVCPEVIPGHDRLALFPTRRYGTRTIPYVPQYKIGSADGPHVWLDGFSPVPPFAANDYAPFPAPNASDPTSWPATAVAQCDLVQTLKVRECGAASLNWTNDIVHVNLGGFIDPGSAYWSQVTYRAVVNRTGYWMSQVSIPPTITTQAIGPYSGALPGFFVLDVPKGYDSVLTERLQAKHNCSMPRQSYSSCSCTNYPGFSQARLDWNIFRTSTMLGNGTTLQAQFQQIMACFDDLLAQAGIPYTSIIRVRVQLSKNASDLDSENQFRSLWKSSHFVSSGWKPTRTLESGVTLYDPNALIGMSIEYAYKGASGEVLRSYNDPLVLSLPDEYSQVVVTPAGFAYTAQIGSTTSPTGSNSVTINNDPTPFMYATAALDPSLAPYAPYYASWIAQQVQVFLNAGIVLARVASDITDIVYQYNIVGPQGQILPFFAISDATAIIFNGTEGNHSPLQLPQRDDSIDVGIPYYLGGGSGVTHTSHFISLDRWNVVVRAPNNGRTPGVTNYTICDGTTDINTCPRWLTRDLGAYVQPTH